MELKTHQKVQLRKFEPSKLKYLVHFHRAQWSGIHEPNQRKTFIHPISNQIMKFSEINPGSLSQTLQNTKLVLLERVFDNDH